MRGRRFLVLAIPFAVLLGMSAFDAPMVHAALPAQGPSRHRRRTPRSAWATRGSAGPPYLVRRAATPMSQRMRRASPSAARAPQPAITRPTWRAPTASLAARREEGRPSPSLTRTTTPTPSRISGSTGRSSAFLLHHCEQLLQEGGGERRHERTHVRTAGGPRRSRSTSTWSRRCAPTATSCSSRPTRAPSPISGPLSMRPPALAPTPSPIATVLLSSPRRRATTSTTSTRESQSPPAPGTVGTEPSTRQLLPT